MVLPECVAVSVGEIFRAPGASPVTYVVVGLSVVVLNMSEAGALVVLHKLGSGSCIGTEEYATGIFPEREK